MSTDLRAALDHGEVRRVITNAYYDARNEGETMEVAADRAADAVMALATTPERCPRCGVRGDDPGMIAEGAVGATRCPRCGKWNRKAATPEPAPALDVERIVRTTLAIVDRTTPLSVGEPLVQRILTRLQREKQP